MSDYWSGRVSFTGLGSDLDVESIISSTMEMEGVRKSQLEDWRDTWEEKADALAELRTALSDLDAYLATMDSDGEFMVKDATCTDSDVVSVSVDADAEDGSHTVTVGQLAQNDVWMNSATGYDSKSASVTASNASLTLSYGGETATIQVAAGTTLEGLANLISNNTTLAGDVRATVIFDGSQYRLQVRGMDQGADNTVSITGSTLAGYGADDFVNTQKAQNSKIKVDGYPAGVDQWMELDSNVVKDIIPGVTMTLKDTTEDARITVGVDTDAVKEGLTDLVDRVNTFLKKVQELSGTDESTGEGAILSGNYGVDIVKSSIKSILSASGIGFSGYDADTGLGDRYTSLSMLGIKTDADQNSSTFGLLVVDEDALDEALDKDPEAVARLFSAGDEGESLSSGLSFESLIKGVTEPGMYEIEYEVADGELLWARINGNEATVGGWSITGRQGQAESGLSLRVDDLSDGTRTAKVGVKRGKVRELTKRLDSLTDADTGTLAVIEDNYRGIVSNTESRIDDETARLDRRERDLRNQYANLEELLGYYDQLKTQLTSQIEQLSS